METQAQRCLPWSFNSDPGFGCVSMTIFETVPFGSPSATNWDCRVTEAWVASTVYKNLPAAATRETTICKSETSMLQFSGIAGITTRNQLFRTSLMCTTRVSDATGSLTTTTPSSSDFASITSSSESPSTQAASDGSESKAWIAGAVVGPIAGLGLCAAAYWLWRRYQNKHNLHLSTEYKVHGQVNDTQQVGPQTGKWGEQVATTLMLHGDSAREPHELDSARKPHELDSARKPHELP